MNHTKWTILNVGALILALTFFACGCGTARPKPQPWNISVTKTTPASIRVDLIGVPDADMPAWESYNMDDYWKDGDPRRREADKLEQTLQTDQPWVIPNTDPKWNEWLDRGATELLIIADLPGHFEPGSGDPRRLFISLDKHAWKGDTLIIEVQDTIINNLTPSRK